MPASRRDRGRRSPVADGSTVRGWRTAALLPTIEAKQPCRFMNWVNALATPRSPSSAGRSSAIRCRAVAAGAGATVGRPAPIRAPLPLSAHQVGVREGSPPEKRPRIEHRAGDRGTSRRGRRVRTNRGPVPWHGAATQGTAENRRPRVVRSLRPTRAGPCVDRICRQTWRSPNAGRRSKRAAGEGPPHCTNRMRWEPRCHRRRLLPGQAQDGADHRAATRRGNAEDRPAPHHRVRRSRPTRRSPLRPTRHGDHGKRARPCHRSLCPADRTGYLAAAVTDVAAPVCGADAVPRPHTHPPCRTSRSQGRRPVHRMACAARPSA